MKVRPFEFEGSAKEDSVLYYVSNTYPGSRLPHEWLNRAVPVTPISTIDLAGERSVDYHHRDRRRGKLSRKMPDY